jgi:hypothetical protein
MNNLLPNQSIKVHPIAPSIHGCSSNPSLPSRCQSLQKILTASPTKGSLSRLLCGLKHDLAKNKQSQQELNVHYSYAFAMNQTNSTLKS